MTIDHPYLFMLVIAAQSLVWVWVGRIVERQRIRRYQMRKWYGLK